jgi:hypothetical protein
MKPASVAIVIVALCGSAKADDTIWHCTGILTSNGVCIGSESNVDSIGNHAPIYGETWRRSRERNR